MKKLNNILILLIASWCSAQNYIGTLQPVSKDGLTKIIVQPELRSAIHNNWSYFRILDSKKNEVPYVIRSAETSNTENTVENLKIISNNSIPNVSTSIIIGNEKGRKLDNLYLKIANTEIVKTYSISGSNDQNQWYGLVSNEIADDLQSSTFTQVEKNFRFPVNNYQFLKIDFIDKKSLPIQVLSASLKTTQNLQKTHLVELKNFRQTITENKSTKTTTIQLKFDSRQVIDGLKFDISGPNYYLRNAEITVNRTRLSKRKQDTYTESVANFQLNSKSQNQFSIGELFEKNITIEIENQDNAPLVIDEIKLFQKPVLLIADLKATEEYTIVVDDKLSSPQYDLSYFDNSTNIKMPEISINYLKKTDVKAQETKQESFLKSPLFMWICIGLALIVIAYFSMGLLKDLGKQD